jgi:hypothetical protein
MVTVAGCKPSPIVCMAWHARFSMSQMYAALYLLVYLPYFVNLIDQLARMKTTHDMHISNSIRVSLQLGELSTMRVGGIRRPSFMCSEPGSHIMHGLAPGRV